MTGHELCDALRRFPLGILCDAHERVRVLSPWIRPLFAGAAFAGPAKTAQTPPGQNAAIHRAIHAARAGDILVVDGGGCHSFGLFGDILAAVCAARGVAGCVIDGAIRDTAAIRGMGFPIFSRNINAAGAGKSDPGQVDTSIICGDVPVHPGDFIIADDDGVAVVPRDIAPRVLEGAQAAARREAELRRRIANGETTCGILGITP